MADDYRLLVDGKLAARVTFRPDGTAVLYTLVLHQVVSRAQGRLWVRRMRACERLGAVVEHRQDARELA